PRVGPSRLGTHTPGGLGRNSRRRGGAGRGPIAYTSIWAPGTRRSHRRVSSGPARGRHRTSARGPAVTMRIGAEEEFHVLDVESGRLVPRAGTLLGRLGGSGFSRELQ